MSRQTPTTAAAERAFVEKAMAMIRTRLYPKVTEAVFRREWQDLLIAISEPAAYFDVRGWSGSAGLYLTVIRKAVEALEARGDVLKSRSRPTMLRAWLQTHLRYHGETYLEEVKAAESKAVAAVTVSVLKGLKPVTDHDQAKQLTATLVAARGLLTPPARVPRRP